MLFSVVHFSSISVEYTEKEDFIYPQEEIEVDEEDRIWHPSYRQNR